MKFKNIIILFSVIFITGCIFTYIGAQNILKQQVYTLYSFSSNYQPLIPKKTFISNLLIQFKSFKELITPIKNDINALSIIYENTLSPTSMKKKYFDGYTLFTHRGTP